MNTMTRMEFLKTSLKAGLFKNRNWILSAFSLTDFNDKKLQGVVHRAPTYSYTMLGDEEIVISDAPKDAPLFDKSEVIEAEFGWLSSIEKLTRTTMGNLMFNACVIDYAFGPKLGYLNDKKSASIKNVEAIIARRLQDGEAPADNSDRSKLYVDELLRYVEGYDYMQGFNFIWCICVTEKLLSVPPNNSDLKKKTVSEVGDKIGQPAVLASVYDVLNKNDAEFLKGDVGAPFTNGKIKVARRKMFLIQGGEAGLTGGDFYDVATNSLAEGIEVAKFPVYNNVLRAGSLNRGHETQLGGVATKEMIRATSNIRVVKGDCGTKLGRVVFITKDNYKRQLLQLSVQTAQGPKFITSEEEAGTYIGKTVIRRTAQYCHSDGENFCEYCVGQRLAMHPTGVSMAITEIGGTLLGIFMSAMHAKELKVHRVTLDSITQ